jgi:hypothetical protein
MLTPIIDAPCGPLRGDTDPMRGVRVFRGVPYATPPVGPLRWRPPDRLPRWTTVQEATAFAPIAVQNPAPDASLFASPEERQSEDCLYLNIWAPLDPPERPLRDEDDVAVIIGDHERSVPGRLVLSGPEVLCPAHDQQGHSVPSTRAIKPRVASSASSGGGGIPLLHPRRPELAFRCSGRWTTG